MTKKEMAQHILDSEKWDEIQYTLVVIASKSQFLGFASYGVMSTIPDEEAIRDTLNGGLARMA